MLQKICYEWKALRSNWFQTWGRWQDHRYLWFIGGFFALFAELFAVHFFQNYLELQPCEMCVYIRFSMLVILLGAAIGFIHPKNIICKALGYLLVVWAVIRGVLWSITLEKANLAVQNTEDLFINTCSITNIHYPFGIPLDRWFPDHFMPTAICGEENWSFLGLNMAEQMLIVYAIFLFFIINMILGWVYNLKHASTH